MLSGTDNLCRWLETKATQIDALDFEKLTFSGRKIVELIRAFNEMLGEVQFQIITLLIFTFY